MNRQLSSNFIFWYSCLLFSYLYILGVFLCCWLPFFITNNLQVFCKYLNHDGPGCTVPDAVMSFIVWLGYINSMLNPLIYAVFNNEYRNGFIKVLKCER